MSETVTLTESSRPSWDDYFMGLAKMASSRSDCLRAQVGAVIVNKRKKVVGTGYNNTPTGVEGCCDRGFCIRIKENIPSGTRYDTCRSIHGEQNAIIQAGEEKCQGSTIYIYGHNHVCVLCRRFIINSGIQLVKLQTKEGLWTDIDPLTWKEGL